MSQAPANPITASSTRLDDFELLDKLGAGGMGAVYRARHKESGAMVALKVIDNPDDDQTRQARFEREVRAASRLFHDNICRVIAFGEAEAKLFMAMELVSGATLLKAIRLRGTLPVPVALEVMRQLLQALACAHSAGVLHRDLKPANIMITPDGTVKLLDFGIAKSQEDATVTATGLLVGTPAFMAPEQVLGGTVDNRSDLFSSGVTFLVMLTGRVRFQGMDPGAVMIKVTNEPVPSLLEECPVAGSSTDRWLQKMCAANMDARFTRAEEAIEMLERLEDYDARGKQLLARYLIEPDVVADELAKRSASTALARAESLVAAGEPGYAAAALALYRAQLLAPSELGRKRFDDLCRRAGFTFDPVDDPRITEALAAYDKTPTAPGVLKRLADLYRADGDVLHAASFLMRYLRVKPNDSHAAQQLRTLLDGPGASDTSQRDGRLRTRDIMAGIKTGGVVSAAVPHNKPPTVMTNVAIGDAAKAAAAKRDATAASGAVGGGGGAQGQPTFVIAGSGGGDRPSLNIHPLILVVGAVVIAGLVLAFFGRFIRTTADDLSSIAGGTANRAERFEENSVSRMQQQLLADSRGQLERHNISAVIRNTTNLIISNPPGEMLWEAYWLRANAFVERESKADARRDLEEYMRVAPKSAQHYEQVKALLDKLYEDQADKAKPTLPGTPGSGPTP